MEKFTINKLIESSKQDGIKLRELLVNNMDEGVNQIIKIVKSGHKGKINLLARVLSCYLEKYPDLFRNLKEKLYEKNYMVLSRLGKNGLRRPF